MRSPISKMFACIYGIAKYILLFCVMNVRLGGHYLRVLKIPFCFTLVASEEMCVQLWNNCFRRSVFQSNLDILDAWRFSARLVR